eukprot:403332926
MDSKQDDQNIPVLCHICSTFFGSKATNFLCSSCHRDEQQYNKLDSQKNVSLSKQELSETQNLTQTQQQERVEQENSNEPKSNEIEEPKMEISPSTEQLPVEPPKPQYEIQVNKSLCWTCKKKVGLLGFSCKCDYVFCGKHRYAEEHKCHFDYHRQHQEKLWIENPLCKNDKFNRI